MSRPQLVADDDRRARSQTPSPAGQAREERAHSHIEPQRTTTPLKTQRQPPPFAA